MSSSPRHTSNVCLLIYTILLLFIWALVIVSATEEAVSNNDMPAVKKFASPERPEDELKNTRNCKALCKNCGCMDFYCGEECICECNKDRSDRNCINTMQRSARKLSVPFEVLIQGPRQNLLLQDALNVEKETYGDHKADVSQKNMYMKRNKRATAIIYKPALENTVAVLEKKNTENRQKRSLPNMDWLGDLKHTLTRPVPLGARRKEIDNSLEYRKDVPTHKRNSQNNLDDSWFSRDNTNDLLRPAPHFRKNKFRHKQTKNGPSDEYNYANQADSMLNGIQIPNVMAEVPKLIKETIEKFNSGSLHGRDLGDAFKFVPQSHGSTVYANRGQTSFDFLNREQNSGYTQALSNKNFLSSGIGIPSMPPPTPVTNPRPDFKIPWGRPATFLRRVNDALDTM